MKGIFQGEHLATGITGNTSLFIAMFLAGCLFLFSVYLIKAKNNKFRFYKWVNPLFALCFIMISVALAMLYTNIFNHYFEYSYVYRYSSVELPLHYLISSLWAGQEGSLLLWLFLIGLVGMINLIIEKPLKAELLLTYSAVVFVFSFLLLGFNFGNFSFGNSPFELLRNNPNYANLNFFRMPNYASLIANGNGLNPLLKNPWMVSHPPLLFLGYALCMVPYAYTIAFLLKVKVTGFVRKVLPWNVTAMVFMSAGLLLGGVWAYQDLTFGGFWAWDPVENASLIPWIVLVAALHFNLVLIKNKPIATIAQVFNFLPFCFVLYAAFLTRSGVLQNSSVHSFSGSTTLYTFGIIAFIFLLFPCLILLLKSKNNSKNRAEETHAAPEEVKNQNNITKEILLYIGAIVLILSAFQIIFITSLPLINKIFGINLAAPIDTETFYNAWQMGFASVVLLLIGLSQYFPFKVKISKQSLFSMLFVAIAAMLATVIIYFTLLDLSLIRTVFLFSMLFCILGTLDNRLRLKNGKKNNAAIISHVGLAIFLLGVLITFTLKQEIDSKTPQRNMNQEGIMAVKGKIIPLSNKRFISYSNRTIKEKRVYYQIDFLLQKDGKYYMTNSMFPSVESSEQMNTVFFPDIVHYFKKDVQVFLTYAEITGDEYKNADSIIMKSIDTINTRMGKIITNGIERGKSVQDSVFNVYLQFAYMDGEKFDMVLSNDSRKPKSIEIPETNLKIELVYADEASCRLYVFQKKTDFVIIKVYEYPFIWVMWLGGFIFFIGIIISVVKRFSYKKKT